MLEVEGIELSIKVPSSSKRVSVGTSGQHKKVDRLICGKEWPKEMIRHHIGSHILANNWSKFGKDRPKFPCGICGIHDSIGVKYSGTSVGACHVWQTAAGNLSFKCQQPLFSTTVKLGSVAECKVNYPCRPIQCPESQCGSLVWSCNMKHHYHEKHQKEM